MQTQLKEKLAQLRDSLASPQNLDAEDVKVLQALERDIQTLLSGPSKDESDIESRIEQQAVAFESQHPQMSGILRDVMDILSKMGI